MAVRQLAEEIGAFAHFLREVEARLAPGEGWYGVFAARDPEGLRACFAGAEIMPWDVVEALLQDLGEPRGGERAARARALHAAAAAVHDRRPGGAAALRERRTLMDRERHYAETRARDLAARLRTAPPDETARLAADLSWTHDTHARATSRIAELTARLAALPDGEPRRPTPTSGGPVQAPAPTPDGAAFPAAPAPVWASAPTPDGAAFPAGPARGGAGFAPASAAGPASASAGVAPAPLPGGMSGAVVPPSGEPFPGGPRRSGPEGGPEAPAAPHAPTPAAPAPSDPAPPTPKPKRRPRGARYAWGDDAVAAVAVPVLPVAGAAPRGARFGGGDAAPEPGTPAPPPGDAAEAGRAAGNAVYALRRLRAQGRSGDAHALLCEALAGPPRWLPALAAELHRAGLAADWATLLWEAASLPPGRLAAVAGALADAGHDADCDQLLRQGVARPVAEVADAVLALEAEGRLREAHALLAAVVRVHPPEDAARLAEADPHRLVPQLLDAARLVAPARERDLRHALRVAGIVTG